MEQEDRSSTQSGTEGDGTEHNRTIQKKEREGKDLAEGPRSRMERNDFSQNMPSPTLNQLKKH